MKFTTHFELYSQTTRLGELAVRVGRRKKQGTTRGSHPPGRSVPGDLHPKPPTRKCQSQNYNSSRNWIPEDFQFELFPLHSPLL